MKTSAFRFHGAVVGAPFFKECTLFQSCCAPNLSNFDLKARAASNGNTKRPDYCVFAAAHAFIMAAVASRIEV